MRSIVGQTGVGKSEVRVFPDRRLLRYQHQKVRQRCSWNGSNDGGSWFGPLYRGTQTRYLPCSVGPVESRRPRRYARPQ